MAQRVDAHQCRRRKGSQSRKGDRQITIFKLFRSLQLQFSGPTGINFRYSYSFVGLTGVFLYSYCSVQLHKKWSVAFFFENYSYSYIKNGFRIKNVMISKRMVHQVLTLSNKNVWGLPSLASLSDYSMWSS